MYVRTLLSADPPTVIVKVLELTAVMGASVTTTEPVVDSENPNIP